MRPLAGIGGAALVAATLLAATACGESSRASGGNRPSGSARQALLGRWQVTFNRAEYVRAGADVAERTIRANWGPFVLTFRPDGHFSVRRTGPPPHQSGSGTYKVRANRVAFTCSCAPSEPWPYYWTVYRDTLTLRRATPDDPEGQTEPTGMVVKPWRRVR